MNNHLNNKLITVFLFLLISISSISCTGKTEGQQKFGVDADYFMGLKLLQNGNEKEARSKFNNCIKKGSYYCAKKSAEALCTFGNIQEKNTAAQNLIARFPEKDSLLIAAKQFESSGEINKLLEITKNLDPVTDKNELIKIRLTALSKRGDSSYEKEVYDWFTLCPISKEHYQFYRDIYNHPDFEATYIYPDLEIEYTPEQFALNYRIELYKRNYTYTFSKSDELLGYFTEGKIPVCEQLASDIGKTYLYGDSNYANNGAKFKKLAAEFSETKMAFYFWFYAGRLYEKGGIYYKQTKNAFEEAIKSTDNPTLKDNALWYLLNNSLNFSVDTITQTIGEYAHQWNDPDYFEDFFESLILSLMASGRWNAFYTIYKDIDGYASDETTAQFAYIYSQLAKEGLVENDDEKVKSALQRTLTAGSAMYYKILGAYELNLSQEEIEKVLCAKYKPDFTPVLDEKSEAAKKLLEGYAYFGFPEMIYPVWSENFQKNLTTDTHTYLSAFLQKIGKDDGNDDYYTQSLRIAYAARKYGERPFTKEELKLTYPANYKDYVETYCKKYDMDPNIMYSLILNESFYDSDVTSSAGAIGLTQLMEFTGSDIAKRLKIQDFDLTDPEININFGTYYLSELIRRCDNKILLGFFSYNAGITRVRRWLQSSLIEFGKKSEMPMDLFLESIPYAETRGYGKKLVPATVIYTWLENPDEYRNCVEKLMMNK